MTFVVVFVVFIIILAIIGGKKTPSAHSQIAEKNERFYDATINSLNEPGQSALRNLKEVWNDNIALDRDGLMTKLNIPDWVDYKDFDAVKNYLGINGNEKAEDIFTTFLLDITQRHSLQYKPLHKTHKAEAFSQYKININETETLYHWIRGCELFEEKVVRRNINYSGYQWNNNGLKSGRLSYSSEVIKDFIQQDNGWLYFTNKRIIYAGRRNNINRSFPYDKILNFKLYQDGILLGMDNGKLPLLKFDMNDNSDYDNPNNAFVTNDGMNQFVRVVSRILNNTQNDDLTTTAQLYS